MGVLEAHDVTKTFRDGREAITVLKGVSLSIDAGEVVVLQGPSGSGKTTFLSVAGCILSPTSGQVRINGLEVGSLPPPEQAAVRRREIGFAFQEFNLFPALTALENVELALNLKGITHRAAHSEAEKLIEAVGLHHRRNALPRDLSGGQKQRVAIARAMCGNPALVLADEPTSNLDSEVGGQILHLFREMAKACGKGLLIVTHDPAVRGIADRIVELHDGRATAESRMHQL